jgi:Fe-S cluster biogenesis protein NfuA
MFIETELTPNPATLKFLPGRQVMTEGTLDIPDAAGAAQSPLAEALFQIPGVSGVYFGNDFITVTKDSSDWPELKPAILGAIMEHFTSGAPLLAEGVTGDPDDEPDEFFEPGDAETVETIKDLIETRVRPAVAGDGGDIKFRGFRDGTVYLAMKGSCSGCPSSTATLRHGIENLLKHYLPAVQAVEPI